MDIVKYAEVSDPYVSAWDHHKTVIDGQTCSLRFEEKAGVPHTECMTHHIGWKAAVNG